MKKILIVDDEAKFVEMLELWLRTLGYEVVSAYNGQSGLDAAKNKKPDLILLDLMLPEINGLRVCSALKADENYKKIPIILFTAFAQGSGKKLAMDAGADFFLSKPFEAEELLSKIKELLLSTPN